MLKQAARELRRRIALRFNPIDYHRRSGVRIGQNVDLIAPTLHMFGSEPYLVTIGDGVTISHDVDFITHDGGLRVIRSKEPGAFFYAPIVVKDGVFLGAHVTVLPGVTIGAGAVTGACSLVTTEIPPGVVAAGVPARPIKSVQDYANAKRDRWIDTAGLDAVQKRELLRVRLGGASGSQELGIVHKGDPQV